MHTTLGQLVIIKAPKVQEDRPQRARRLRPIAPEASPAPRPAGKLGSPSLDVAVSINWGSFLDSIHTHMCIYIYIWVLFGWYVIEVLWYV